MRGGGAACRWQCAVERLARMPPRLPGDSKLMTLFLGRTRAGIATVQPHAWLLYAPASAARRYDMFRTSLLFHRMLCSSEYLVRPLRHWACGLRGNIGRRRPRECSWRWFNCSRSSMCVHHKHRQKEQVAVCRATCPRLLTTQRHECGRLFVAPPPHGVPRHGKTFRTIDLLDPMLLCAHVKCMAKPVQQVSKRFSAQPCM